MSLPFTHKIRIRGAQADRIKADPSCVAAHEFKAAAGREAARDGCRVELYLTPIDDGPPWYVVPAPNEAEAADVEDSDGR